MSYINKINYFEIAIICVIQYNLYKEERAFV